MFTRKNKIRVNNKTRREKSSYQTLTCPSRRMNTKYQIGTSGFMVSQSVWLDLGCLNCIEINGTFYRIPSSKLIEKWRNYPKHLSVVIKASRYITHVKRLNDVEEGWKILWNSIKCLGPKLQAILFQLPPSFIYKEENMERIEKMHKYIPSKLNIVFEFRDISWFKPEVYETFKKMKWCIAGTYVQKRIGTKWMGTMPGGLELPPRTASFNYLRIHGERGYKGSLDAIELKEIKKQIDEQGGNKSFIMFNNTFFDPRSKYCMIGDNKIKYAAVCNAVEFSSLI